MSTLSKEFTLQDVRVNKDQLNEMARTFAADMVEFIRADETGDFEELLTYADALTDGFANGLRFAPGIAQRYRKVNLYAQRFPAKNPLMEYVILIDMDCPDRHQYILYWTAELQVKGA